MKKRQIPIVLLASAVCLAGCTSKNKGKIEGTNWSSLPTTIKGVRVPAGGLQLRFHKDGQVVYKTIIGNFTGTYSLNSGNYITMKFDRKLAGRNVHQQKVVVKGKRLTMSDTDGTSATFRLTFKE